MKFNTIFFIQSIVIFFLVGCSPSNEILPQQEKLRIKIAESIDIPFNEVDTVLYVSYIGLCGNATEEERNRFFTPSLDENPYSKILENNYEGKIWFYNLELYDEMKNFCQEEKGPTLECFRKNKINFHFGGNRYNNSYKTTERYILDNKVWTIEKLFQFKYNSWNLKIISEIYKEHNL